ncbi:GATA domain-containing protein [Cephalotus follicularis]|uniref:GATA domain-containing protein n=1 Tax=Cephalotus follicularis TaxID=3775 RepID=A0A1Q3CH87_CEPFO|nr:GATA domain-containing protein [Cephalotus follicularis]
MGIIDLTERKSLSEETMGENRRCCTDCKTTKTPLWRGGPAGPKSLCNACGIRYRKKRRAMKPSNNINKQEKKRERSHNNTTINTKITTSTTCSSTNNADAAADGKGSNGNGLSEFLKMRLIVLGNEVLLQRSSSIVKKQRCQRRRKLGEEEQAAFSLMALSRGSVFA